MPRYYGSDDYEAQAAPLLDVQIGRFFARTGEGIGFNVYRNSWLTTGISANWIQGYDEDDAPPGLNEVKMRSARACSRPRASKGRWRCSRRPRRSPSPIAGCS